MATVVRRDIISSPQRDAHATWGTISELLTQSADADVRDEFVAVAGVAASIIADRTPVDAPIVVTSKGPRTRIYCLYDEDAIDGSGANEEGFGFDPLNGDWQVSLPCEADDLDWVRSALAPLSSRITARDRDASFEKDTESSNDAYGLNLNPEKFLAS